MAQMFFVVTSSLLHTTQKWTHASESFSTEPAAMSRFYKYLSDMYTNPNIECCNAIVKNEHGRILDNKYFENHFEEAGE